MATIIDGKELSLKIKDEIKRKVGLFNEKTGRVISLAVIMVGNNPASAVYVNNKIKAAEYVGMKSLSFHLPETATFTDVKNLIDGLSNDNNVDGILVQLPLPKHLDEEKVLSLIPVNKDVDGFLPENVGNLLLGHDCIVSCTPAGVMEMLKSTGENLSGKNAVVIGRSNIVGKPMALLLLKENCTVTVCHSKSKNIKNVCKKADIIVVAIGKAGFLTANMVKKGAIVVDVGISKVDGKIKGDVDFDKVSKKASFITPVPGGVGPMTIAMLLSNTYKCAVRRENLDV